MQAAVVYCDYIGIVEKKMVTIMGYIVFNISRRLLHAGLQQGSCSHNVRKSQSSDCLKVLALILEGGRGGEGGGVPILYIPYKAPQTQSKVHRWTLETGGGTYWRPMLWTLGVGGSKLCLCIAAEGEALNPSVDT